MIMKQPVFNSIEREAIVCLVIEMVNADRAVEFEELVMSNHINHLLGITEEEFAVALRLQPEHACKVVSEMDDDKKRFVAMLLREMIDADGKVATEECRTLNWIARLTGIDELF